MQQSEMETNPLNGESTVDETELQQEAEQRQEWKNILSAAYDAGETPLTSMAQPEQPATPEIATKDMLTPLIGMGFGILAPNWGVTAEEAEQLAEAYALVVDKYFPDGVPMGPEVGAAMVTMAVFAPRIGTPRKLPDSEPEAKKEAEDGTSKD